MLSGDRRKFGLSFPGKDVPDLVALEYVALLTLSSLLKVFTHQKAELSIFIGNVGGKGEGTGSECWFEPSWPLRHPPGSTQTRQFGLVSKPHFAINARLELSSDIAQF
jgi:hypothetical protein